MVGNVPSGAVAARERTCGISQKVADGFVEALCKPEEDVEALVAIHTDDCEVGNVSLPGYPQRPRRLARVLDELP